MTEESMLAHPAVTEDVSLLSFFSRYLAYHNVASTDIFRPESAPWAGHIPFADMLVRSCRPACLVELGTCTGVSLFAFCEAVRQAWLDTRCMAVDTWKGDEHAGYYGEDVYANVAAHAEKHYPRIACLMRMTFDEAAPCFDDGSIDILHIDGLHTYEAVRHDFDAWLPKVKPGGIILLHDVAERREGFGVWRLWHEIAPLSAETCCFTHSHGLGVWRKPGGPAPDHVFLRTLFSPDTAASAAVQAAVQLVSRQFHYGQQIARLEQQCSTLEKHARNLDAECTELRKRVLELDAQRDHMLASRSWRLTRPLRALAAWLRARRSVQGRSAA